MSEYTGIYKMRDSHSDKVMRRFIYHLIDPRNGEVFYVGQTTDPGKRLQEHVAGGKATQTRKSRLSEIVCAGQFPIMKTITSVTGTYHDACKVEYTEISKFPKDQLTNGKHYGKKGIRQ